MQVSWGTVASSLCAVGSEQKVSFLDSALGGSGAARGWGGVGRAVRGLRQAAASGLRNPRGTLVVVGA